jgi:hypothetical protein
MLPIVEKEYYHFISVLSSSPVRTAPEPGPVFQTPQETSLKK